MILASSYNRIDYISFLKNKLLTDDFLEKNNVIKLQSKYKYINLVTELGYDKTLKLRVLEIIYNSDNDPRISITKESFEIMKQKRYKNALVFFIPKNSKEHYRFSFITSDLELNDKGKVIKNFSNPKRYSFLLGKDAKIVTPYKALIEKGKLKDFKDLQDRFSVEPVTKEFFQKYKEIFENFNTHSYKRYKTYDFLHSQDDLKIGKKKIRDFNKKLLGRLVFLMFLQKKGWLDASTLDYNNGDKNFLSKLYERSVEEKKSFYSDYLEPLFYDTLNKERKEDISSITNIKNGKIPFLNGGLFEKEKGEIGVSYDHGNKERDLFKSLFHKDDGLFNQYNFTIIENDYIDQEVAVDPEMLGHIFENLLENNKDNGVFYTPKEIVNYMSKSSLLEYLKIAFRKEEGRLESGEEEVLKELVFYPEIADFRIHFIEKNRKLLSTLLDDVKILDPAIGSGAFPMGMLQAIVRVKEVLNHELNRGKAKRKIIENSIYGVDIDSGAVNIARLRFWLSLIVDEDKPSPLPNLDFKIVVGNSLVSILKIRELEEVIDLSPLRNNNIELDSDMLKKLLYAKSNFYKGKGKKKELKKEIRKYETEILTIIFKKKIMKLSSSEGKHCEKVLFSDRPKNHKKCELYKSKKALLEETLEDIKTKDYSIFDYYLNFNEVFEDENGFDIIIGNPPYIKEGTNKGAFDGFRETSPYYIGKMDLWYGFASVGLDLLKNEGILSFIATNNWVTNLGAKKLRKKVLEDSKILEFIDFGDFKVFENAGIQTMIMNLLKTNDNNKYLTKYSKIRNKKLEKNKIANFLRKEVIQDFNVFNAQIIKNNLKNKNIIFLEKYISKILDIIENNKNFELRDDEVANAIHTHHSSITNKMLKINNSFNLGEGIFVISTKEKNELKLTKDEQKLIKPLYTTNEIDKYYFNKENNFWIIYTNSKFKNPNEIKPYPNIKKHLDRFKIFITSDNKPYGLHRARNESFFKEEKIIALRKSTKYPRFSYLNKTAYIQAEFYMIKSERINLKYLTALFNSKLITFWLKHKGKMQGNNYQLDKEPLINIPINNIKMTKPFEIIVDYIIFLKTLNEPINEYVSNKHIINSFEKVIDAMVYELYFKEEFQSKLIQFEDKKGYIKFIEYAKEDYTPIDGLDKKETIEVINYSYRKLKEPYNKIRNNLILLPIHFKELISPIVGSL